MPGFNEEHCCSPHIITSHAPALLYVPLNEAVTSVRWTAMANGARRRWQCARRTDHFVQELNFPHSLGLFYAPSNYHAGFRVNSVNTKLMDSLASGEAKIHQAYPTIT